MTKPISDEELDELAMRIIATAVRDVCAQTNEAKPEALAKYILYALKNNNLAPRLLSHYRSARNYGLEEAAKIVDGYKPPLQRYGGPANFDLPKIAAAIRALKSPPQSEPGTKP